jgi:hypothetical protein
MPTLVGSEQVSDTIGTRSTFLTVPDEEPEDDDDDEDEDEAVYENVNDL